MQAYRDEGMAEIYTGEASLRVQPIAVIGAINQLSLSSNLTSELHPYESQPTSPDKAVISSSDNNNDERFHFCDESKDEILLSDNTVVKLGMREARLAYSQSTDSKNWKSQELYNVLQHRPYSSHMKSNCHSAAKRRVSFADHLGQELTSIRIMTEGRDTPPRLASQDKSHASEVEGQTPNLYKAQFEQPISNFKAYLQQLSTKNVALDSFSIFGRLFNGSVKVRNIAYEKSVFIRYTTNNWCTSADYSCDYINMETLVCRQTPANEKVSPTYDTFSFQFDIPIGCNALEFCVGFICAGQTYWDNNSGSNYFLVSI